MQVTYSLKFNLPWTILHPGDHYATNKAELISTLLGSCIAVVLLDKKNSIAGMNHFLLPNATRHQEFYRGDSGRYGTYAMDLLINSMMKLGAKRDSLVAKVFGGGHMLGRSSGKTMRLFSAKHSGQFSAESLELGDTIPENNIRFILDYLATEQIPLLSHDLGGNMGRRLYLFQQTKKVLLSRMYEAASLANLAKEEREYIRRVRKRLDKPGDDSVTLFK